MLTILHIFPDNYFLSEQTCPSAFYLIIFTKEAGGPYIHTLDPLGFKIINHWALDFAKST